MRKGKNSGRLYILRRMVFLYPFFDGYLNSFLYGIGYLCERMISLRGDMSAENNEKHQK